MSLPYVAPAKMAEYTMRIQLFAAGASHLNCVRSHYFIERTGTCDLTGAKEQEEIFVLSNRNGATMKVSKAALQIVANIVEIQGADEWYAHLKETKKLEREKKAAEEKAREVQRSAPKGVVFRRKPVELLEKIKKS